ncbi:MAG: hypothetical protein ACI9G9_000162 [Psychromonas sp.]|jgi:hypothetical protein
MKPIYLSIIFFLGLLLSASLVGCKKYDSNAKFIELKTVKSRLCGREWRLDNVSVFYRNNDSIGSYDTKNFKLNFTKSGRFTFSNEKAYEYSAFFEDGLVGGGNWEFDQDKQHILFDFGSRNLTFYIDALNKKQLRIEHVFNEFDTGENFYLSGFKR